MTTVLVAEDDQDVRDLVAFKLEQSGFDVIAVSDGTAALSAAREHVPEMAVLDVTMPGMSGLDVCRLLRAAPGTNRMLIIMLTASTSPADVERGFRAGADDYIGKPFSLAELTDRVEALFAKARRGRRTLS